MQCVVGETHKALIVGGETRARESANDVTGLHFCELESLRRLNAMPQFIYHIMPPTGIYRKE